MMNVEPAKRCRLVVLSCGLGLSLVGIGCAPHYSPLPDRTFPDSEVMPHATEMEGDPLRIVVGLDVPSGFADELGVEHDLLREVITLLDETGVDARMNTQNYSTVYKDVIRLAELKSNEVYAGSQRVSYVVQGQLNESSFQRVYKKPLPNPFSDAIRPGKCVSEARISLSLEAISLPRTRRAKKWLLSASDSASYSAMGDCNRPEERGAPQQKRDEVRRTVVDKIAGCLEGPLMKFFTPRAYITGFQSDGEKYFFSISGGSAAGFHAGNSVDIDRMLPLDKGGGARRIAGGRITDEIQEHSAFIELGGAVEAEKVQRGDRVRVTVTNFRAPLCVFILEEH